MNSHHKNICFEVDHLQGLVTDSLSLTLLSVNRLISHILKPCKPSCLQGFNSFSAPRGLIIYVFVLDVPVSGTNISRLQIV